jgi:hypothetical protein
MTTKGFIEFIEVNHLPGLIWYFGVCPLREIAGLQPEISIEKNGEILSAVRCYVVLHRPGNGEDIIPQNMIEEFETFPMDNGYQITIPIVFKEFDQSSN